MKFIETGPWFVCIFCIEYQTTDPDMVLQQHKNETE